MTRQGGKTDNKAVFRVSCFVIRVKPVGRACVCSRWSSLTGGEKALFRDAFAQPTSRAVREQREGRVRGRESYGRFARPPGRGTPFFREIVGNSRQGRSLNNAR